jgi:hypothetical protein
MFGSIGRVSCDADGDVIFNVGSTVEGMGPFLRVQGDGARHVVYSLPSELVKASNIAWTVTPEGRFYVLIENFKNHRLVHFNEDGSVAGIATLDIPSGVDVRFVAITDDETILLRGNLASSDSLRTSRTGFAALLNSTGRLVRDLSSIAPKTPSAPPADGPIDGDAVAGTDGRFYVLDEARVLVLNKSGEIERELSFTKPTKDARAVQVDYSMGQVSIVFHTVRRDHKAQRADVQVRTIILNTQTGERQGDFEFGPDTTGSVLCFDARDGYSLMAVDGEMAAKDIVPVR